MSKRYSVTKNFRKVLPKVKGHIWDIDYLPGGNGSLGNVSIYLWSIGFLGKNEIVSGAYVTIDDSHTTEEVQKIVLSGVQVALDKAKELLKGIPSNILNQSSISEKK